jgi:type VI protein secretion system component Hcp
MADKDSIDVLMTFIVSGTTAVPAEGTSEWDKDDTDMMEGFQDGMFFEVDDFSFGVSLGGSENSGGAEAAGTSPSSSPGKNELHSRDGHGNPANVQKGASKAGSANRFAKYIESGTQDFKPEVQEITITRQVDIASVRFLQSCFNYSKFERAILVKRKFTGNTDFHEAFLRLEFKEPLITGVEWDEGEIVKEKLKFVCRGVVAAYRQQNADGTLKGARSASWTPTRKVVAGGTA